MGVLFPDLTTPNAIGSNMYEEFEPSEKIIRLYLDYRQEKSITLSCSQISKKYCEK